jgi:predicted ATP-dependent endonuclease of OLD family
MELLYLYIQKYKGISDLGVHFTNKCRVKFLNEEKTEAELVAINNYIPGFFAENINNVMAIVGKNGVGKTTILRYIMQYLSDGNTDADERSIIVFEDADKIYYKSPHEIQLRGTTKEVEMVDDLDDFKQDTQLIYVSTFLDPTAIYSTDYSKEQLGISKNLSTNFLLFHDIRQRRIFQDAEQTKFSYEERFNAFASYELIRIVKLFQWYDQFPSETANLFIKKPKFLNLRLHFHDDSPNAKKLLDQRTTLQNFFRNHLSNNNRSANEFLLTVFEAGLFHLIDSGEFAHPSTIGSFFVEEIARIVATFINTETTNAQEPLISTLLHLLTTVEVNDRMQVASKPLKSLKVLLSAIHNFMEAQDAGVVFGNNVLALPINSFESDAISELLNAYYSVDRIGDFAEFYFSHDPGNESSFSSGEYSFLTLLARINSTFPETSNPSLLLLIDEAELALHPRWQVQFINRFTQFIKLRFSQAKVQMVLTSHSPFILSDLPPHCVTLIDRENGKAIVVDTLAKGTHTFGGNVHELFTDSFFLADGLMGEFARIKIKDLITDINQERLSSITSEIYDRKYKKRIEIIGEPFLHRKVLELISEKSTSNTLDRIIADRSREIDNLKEIRRQRQDDSNQ